jgi:signal transduction histidine kinase
MMTDDKKIQANQHILVVDDEPLITQVLEKLLTREGFKVDTAENGAHAVACWQAANESLKPIDLIITDLRMPVMDGVALIKTVRELGSDVPIIVISGHAELSEAFELVSDYQISDLITKPVNDVKSLLFSVGNALEKVYLSRELKWMNEALERLVHERTEQLKVEKEKVEEALAVKSQFLNRMSHELRTPLNAIIGFSQMQNKHFDEDTSEHLVKSSRLINEAGNRLLGLVENMMDMNELQRSDELLELESVEVDRLIESALEKNQNRVESKNVSVTHQTSGLKCMANAQRLIQVLDHLICNAIKFNHKDGQVNISSQLLESAQLEISISDTGIGIDPSEHKTIFQPFSRLEFARKQEIEGTGIGLTLVSYLLQRMKGSISVTSNVDEGSTFLVRLSVA